MNIKFLCCATKIQDFDYYVLIFMEHSFGFIFPFYMITICTASRVFTVV